MKVHNSNHHPAAHQTFQTAASPFHPTAATATDSHHFATPSRQINNSSGRGGGRRQLRHVQQQRHSISVLDCSEEAEPPPPVTVAVSHGSARTTNNMPAIRMHQQQNAASRRRPGDRQSVADAAAVAVEAVADVAVAVAAKPATDQSECYRQAIDLIVQRCAALSADNERLVHRLHYVKQMTRRKERDVALLKRRLDEHSDGWRTAQPDPQLGAGMPTLIPATNNVIVRKKYKKRKKPLELEQQPVAEQPEQQHDVQVDEMQMPPMQPDLQEQPEPEQQHPYVITVTNSAEPVIIRTNFETVPDDEPVAHIITRPTLIVQPAAADAATPAPTIAAAVTPRPADAAAAIPPARPIVAAPMRVLVAAPRKPAGHLVPKVPPKRHRAPVERVKRDPHAPKRPANPFFQFCQEQRSILMGELHRQLMPGEPELSKQELTRQLANRWRLLDAAGKQTYIDMYESSKRKYTEDMQCYREAGGGAGAIRRLQLAEEELQKGAGCM